MSLARNKLGEYLGDGVHAQFDGFMIWLLVERCDNPFAEKPNIRIERVALDSSVFEALCRFADRVWPLNDVETAKAASESPQAQLGAQLEEALIDEVQRAGLPP